MDQYVSNSVLPCGQRDADSSAPPTYFKGAGQSIEEDIKDCKDVWCSVFPEQYVGPASRALPDFPDLC